MLSAPVPHRGDSDVIGLGELPPLDGRRVVMAGFEGEQAAALEELFDAAGAFCRGTTLEGLRPALRNCDLAILPVSVAAGQGIEPDRVPATLMVVVPRDANREQLRWLEKAPVDYVFYPCPAEELLARAAIAVRRRRPSQKAPRGEQVRVLLADDDASITALLKATLESAGMVCRCARDGLEALAAIREWQPEVAVLDVNMPGMDGYQILAALREEPPTGDLKIMLLTGYDQESEVLKGFKLGAGDYVIKPFNPLEVLARVKRMAAETP